jgi:TatD DNase family protein
MTFADTHTHLYAEEFSCDRQAAVTRAIDNGVKFLFLPAIDSAYHQPMLDLSNAFPGNCFPMIGLHPTSVKQNYCDELKIVQKYLCDSKYKFYGVGEIGIDLYWDKTFEAEQREVFSCQLELAIGYKLPAIIHTRNSMDIALSIVEEFRNPGLKGIFHCFSGNKAQADRAVKAGFKLGIGGVVTFRNSGLQKVVEMMPLESIVLETDAPYLAPAPHRGKRNEPAYIPLIAEKIAEIKHLTVEEVAEVTTRTALAIFNIS